MQLARVALEPHVLACGAEAVRAPGETAASVVEGVVDREVLRAGGGRVSPDMGEGKSEQRDRAR